MIHNPFNATFPTNGAWNSSHSRKFSVAYTPLTLPRPWPYILVSFTVSTGLALWSIISDIRDHKKTDTNKRPSGWEKASVLVKITAITYRAVAALVQAVSSNPHNPNATGGRVASSTLFVMFLSIVPYVLSYRGLYWITHLRLLLLIDMLLVYIAMCTNLTDEIKPDWSQYGTWVASDIVCPIYVSGCSSKEVEDVRRRFYCDPATNADLGRGILSQKSNHLAIAELAITWIGFIIGGGILMAAGAGINARLLEGLSQPDYSFVNPGGQPHPNFDAEYTAALGAAWRSLFRKQKWFPFTEENFRYNKKLYYILFILFFIIIPISLSVHVYSETQPKNFSIVDGLPGTEGLFGYPDWAVDCYTTHTPVDTFGFWRYWWSMETKSLAAKIALV